MATRQIEVTGTVIQKTVSSGSKSEHSAVVIETAEGESYELRLRGGNPFEPEAGLRNLVGKRITTRGIAADGSLFIEDWQADIPE